MLTEYEYQHYNKCIDAVLSGSHHSLVDAGGDYPIEIWNYHGERTELEHAYLISMYHDQDIKIFYYIEIQMYSIKFEQYNGDGPCDYEYEFTTELFEQNTDEEFFQIGTVQDLSLVKEEFLRKLISLSLLIRNNKWKEEI